MISTDTIQDYIETFWDDYDVDEGIEYAEWHIRTVNSIALRAFGKSFPDHDYDKVDRDDEARVLMYGRRYTRNDDSELDPLLQDYYIGQHVKMHEHHPEHWDDSIDIEDFHESRPPHVDCSRMTDKALTELVCDWSAVAVSFGSDLLSWYKRTVGDDKRFGFTKRQRRIILNGFEKVADTCANLGCYLDKNELHRLLADVKMDEKVLEEKNYHVDGLPTDIGTLEGWVEDEDALMEFVQRVKDEGLYDTSLQDAFERYSEEELKEELSSLLSPCIREYRKEYEKGTVKLYRSLCLDEEGSIDEDELGECWAHSLYGVGNFLEWKEWDGKVTLLCAETPVDNIDWVATFLLEFDTYYDEDEYRVLDDSKMTVLWEKEFNSSQEVVKEIRGNRINEKVYHEGLPSTIEDVRNFYENPSELREFLKRVENEDLYDGGEYRCIIDQWYGESDEYIDNELKKDLDGFLHKHIGTLDDKGAEEEYAEGTIRLYRVIGYNTEFDVNMGRCWSKGLDGVCYFLDNWGEPLKGNHFKLVHASTSTDNINWVATLLAVLDGYCEERERRVVDDSKMDIIWVKDFDSYDSAYSYISENM